MKTLKIIIGSLLITLCSCSKMDTNTGSGKVKMIKEFNNWIVDKTTSESTSDEKYKSQLDSITTIAKSQSLYPDELTMEVIKKTDIDLNKFINEYYTFGDPIKCKNSISGTAIPRLFLSTKTKTALLDKFKRDDTGFQVLSLRFRNRINDNQFQFECINVLFDQNGRYTFLTDRPYTNDISPNAESSAIYILKNDYLKRALDEVGCEFVVEECK